MGGGAHRINQVEARGQVQTEYPHVPTAVNKCHGCGTIDEAVGDLQLGEVCCGQHWLRSSVLVAQPHMTATREVAAAQEFSEIFSTRFDGWQLEVALRYPHVRHDLFVDCCHAASQCVKTLLEQASTSLIPESEQPSTSRCCGGQRRKGPACESKSSSANVCSADGRYTGYVTDLQKRMSGFQNSMRVCGRWAKIHTDTEQGHVS